MRIQYVSDIVLPSRAANTVNVAKMCGAFVELGHAVTLLCRKSVAMAEHYGVSEDIHTVDISSPKWPLVGGVLFAAAVRKALRREPRPDLCYGRHIYGVAAAAQLGVPVMLELHQVPAKLVLRKLVTWLSRRAECRAVVVISDALRRDLAAALPDAAHETFLVAHDAADVPAHGSGTALIDWRGRPGALQVGYVGNLYPGKGMEVVERLAAAKLDVDFHIVGGTEEHIQHWRSRCGESHVHFHGFVAHACLPSAYGRFDVAIAPLQSRIEGAAGGDIARWTSPLKIFEYMASGKAIVASDLPVLREVLQHESNALLVPPDDIAGWERALQRLADDTNLRDRLGKQARDDFARRHTWKQRAQAILHVLEPARLAASSGHRLCGSRR